MRVIARYLIVATFVFTGLIGKSQGLRDYSPVYRYNRAIIGWATESVVIRGMVKIDDQDKGMASFGHSSDAIGPADNIVVSLGDGGIAVLGFSQPVKNNPGPDFAVFENSFDGSYLELAFVEVSSDSARWVRFPAVSNTQTDTQILSFGTIDSDQVHNLAGNYPVFFGTPFYLEDIEDSLGIDTDDIRYIRIIDVVGSLDPAYCTYDSQGNIINDPWPTPFPQSGFDLDAVAVMDISSVGIDDSNSKNISLYPNPATDRIIIDPGNSVVGKLRIVALNSGRQITDWLMFSGLHVLSLEKFQPGAYLIEIHFEDTDYLLHRKFIKVR